MRTTSSLWFTGATLLATACGGRDGDFERAADLLPVAATKDHAAFIDRANSEARLIDVSGERAKGPPNVVDLPADPLLTVPRAGDASRGELLVLCAGHPDDGEARPESPALVVLDGEGEARRYELASAFNRIEQSEDGRYAFLMFDAARNDAALASVLFNPNEVAVVDLDQTGEDAVHARTLRSLDGSSPLSVAFSPSMEVAGQTRRIAVALFASDVGLFDLDHDRDDFTIELSPSKTTSLGLSRVLFSEHTPRFYVIGSGSEDVFAITLLPRDATPADGDEEPNDFTPSVSQVFVGGSPSDLALYDELGEERLLVTTPASSLAVIVDPATNRTTQVALGASEREILMFEGPTPADPTFSQRALLFTPNSSVVTFVDLAGIEEDAGRRTETFVLDDAFARLAEFGDQTVMLVNSGAGLSLLDLHERTVASIVGPNLGGAVTDPATGKLWLAPAGSDRVSYLDLATFHPADLKLDAPVTELVTVPSASRPRVVVKHAGSTGYVTVIDGTSPSIGTAYSVRNFLYEGLLDRGGE